MIYAPDDSALRPSVASLITHKRTLRNLYLDFHGGRNSWYYSSSDLKYLCEQCRCVEQLGINFGPMDYFVDHENDDDFLDYVFSSF